MLNISDRFRRVFVFFCTRFANLALRPSQLNLITKKIVKNPFKGAQDQSFKDRAIGVSDRVPAERNKTVGRTGLTFKVTKLEGPSFTLGLYIENLRSSASFQESHYEFFFPKNPCDLDPGTAPMKIIMQCQFEFISENFQGLK